MQLLRVVAVTGLFFVCAAANKATESCNVALTIPTFKQEDCLGIWYQYGSEEECKNCCVIRELILLEPGVLNITDTLYKPGASQPIVNSFIARRNEISLTYYYGSDIQPMLIIDGTCFTYVSLKKRGGTKMEVFTRQVKPLLVPEIPKCNIKIYDYNPGEACLKYI